jgi:hypothetical protein
MDAYSRSWSQWIENLFWINPVSIQFHPRVWTLLYLTCLGIGFAITALWGPADAIVIAMTPWLMGLAMAFGILTIVASFTYADLNNIKLREKTNPPPGFFRTNILCMWAWIKANPLKAFVGLLAFAALLTVIILSVGYFFPGVFAIAGASSTTFAFMAPVFNFMNSFIAPALVSLDISATLANAFAVISLAIGVLFIWDTLRDAIPYGDGPISLISLDDPFLKEYDVPEVVDESLTIYRKRDGQRFFSVYVGNNCHLLPDGIKQIPSANTLQNN